MSSDAREEEGISGTFYERERRKQRRLLWLLGLLLLLLVCVIVVFLRYLARPAPLPDIIPLPVEIKIAPHYLFSIYGVDNPVAVGVSPQGDRIYVAETGDERLIKIFDRDGDLLGAFAPPRTEPSERSPVYLTTDPAGRVWVTDRLQHGLFLYDRDGAYLDTILSPDLTLSEYIAEQLGGLGSEISFAYDTFERNVYYRQPGAAENVLPAPVVAGWAPLGVRVDKAGDTLVTDVMADRHTVYRIPAGALAVESLSRFDAPVFTFGAYGQNDGQFLFPNAAVTDSRGRFFVTDSNNGRVSSWDSEGLYLFSFGQGSGDDALRLPRGATIDDGDRLYVVDAVGQSVKVYDVSGSEAEFLFSFGNWGVGDGEFDYPNDIVIDVSGRIYVADRENNRVQVWLY